MAFDIYHSGYEIGYADGVKNGRRRNDWELKFYPLALLPLVDTASFIKGYHDGYQFGLTKQHWIQRDSRR